MVGDVNHSISPFNLKSFLPGLHIGSLFKREVAQSKGENVVQKKPFGCPLFLLNSWYFCSFLRNPPVKTGQSESFFQWAWREWDLLCRREMCVSQYFFYLWVTFFTSVALIKQVWRGFFFFSRIIQYKLWLLSKVLLCHHLNSVSILPIVAHQQQQFQRLLLSLFLLL